VISLLTISCVNPQLQLTTNPLNNLPPKAAKQSSIGKPAIWAETISKEMVRFYIYSPTGQKLNLLEPKMGSEIFYVQFHKQNSVPIYYWEIAMGRDLKFERQKPLVVDIQWSNQKTERIVITGFENTYSPSHSPASYDVLKESSLLEQWLD